MNFDYIILEEEQKELFIKMVENARDLPRNERLWIYLEKAVGGYLTIENTDTRQHKLEDVIDSDLDELAGNKLLRNTFRYTDAKSFAITPQGFQYYEWLMKQQGKPVERIEKSILKYIEIDTFKTTYSEAYKKLKLAEDKLWASDSPEHFTAIGHHCREAMQEFADRLYQEVFGNGSDENKASTIKRLRAILDKKEKEIGKTVKPFLEALLAYWGTLSDLVQRQEHGAQKEGEPLTWEDTRRVVFQTVNVMVELDRTLGS